MRLSRVRGYLVKWPFRMHVEHSLARNEATENIIVELTAEDGSTGFGEGVPRVYVTGETSGTALDALKDYLCGKLLGQEFPTDNPTGFMSSLFEQEVLDETPSAACALETALLDLAGRASGRPLADFFCRPKPSRLVHSAVIPLVPDSELPQVLAQVKQLKLSQIKIKVSEDNSRDRVAEVRDFLGREAQLRVDANGAWDAAQAIRQLKLLTPLGVTAVEQPVPKDDLNGMAHVKKNAKQLVIADESLCNENDAQRLISHDAVGAFNLRLSKCGGLSRAKRLLDLAKKHGVKCQLGCHVGELGILSAAGRHFAQCQPDLIFLEGSLTNFVVGRDVLAEDLTFPPGGGLNPISAPGLGVTVLKERLEDSLVFDVS